MDKSAEIKEVDVVRQNPFLEMIERVASNPDIDADKIQKILDMQIQVMDREARDQFYDAMNRVQSKLPTVVKDARNQQTNSNYARHESIARAIKPIYTMEGFSTSFTQDKSDTQGYIRIRGSLRHKSGHVEDHYFIDLPADKVGLKGSVNKTDLHAAGSTFTYGRRYLTCLMFDVATGDDNDGNAQEAFVTDEQQANIEALLEEISEEHRAEFWKRARTDSVDTLLAHNYSIYVTWLEKKRADS